MGARSCRSVHLLAQLEATPPRVTAARGCAQAHRILGELAGCGPHDIAHAAPGPEPQPRAAAHRAAGALIVTDRFQVAGASTWSNGAGDGRGSVRYTGAGLPLSDGLKPFSRLGLGRPVLAFTTARVVWVWPAPPSCRILWRSLKVSITGVFCAQGRASKTR